MDIKQRIVNKYIQYFCKKPKKPRNPRSVDAIHVFYRICDSGYPKEKPTYITKENCLRNAISAFPVDKVHWHILADNVCEETYQMILRYVPQEWVEKASVGHGAGTFRMVLKQALTLKDDDLVYFLEDDYLHLPNALDNLIEAANYNAADYITLYDHPDKYSSQSSCSWSEARQEVFFTGHHHWRTTSSTTMTFAAFVNILKRDYQVFMRWTETTHPYDYQIFIELGLLNRARLISPIPSLSTHGETAFLAPCINWEDYI
ncbi:MAG: hypothetical protein J5502_06995 [Prevotella sp.]|nr:hypothetical protein [Prevotella sp.]